MHTFLSRNPIQTTFGFLTVLVIIISNNILYAANTRSLDDTYYTRFVSISDEFAIISKYPDKEKINRLIIIDAKARQLVERFNAEPHKTSFRLPEAHLNKLSISAGYFFTDTTPNKLEYSGAPLLLAHAIDPNSKHRHRTLYGAIQYGRSGIEPTISQLNEWGLLDFAFWPDMKLAVQYASEFPQGKFINEVHLILGRYYKDLYIMLRDNKLRLTKPDEYAKRAKSPGEDILYNCYKEMIKERYAENDYEAMLSDIRLAAISNFKHILNQDNFKDEAAQTISKINDDTVQEWSYCEISSNHQPNYSLPASAILDNLYSEYKKIRSTNQNDEIAPLVEIDARIRFFIYSLDNSFENAKTWKKHYKELGLTIGHFSDVYEYNGWLLDKAHAINPNSKYREHTLFSEIHSDQYCWVQDPNNLKAAFRYLEEYPEGYFAAEVHKQLGGFYFSLHNDLLFYQDEIYKYFNTKRSGEHSHMLPYIKDPALTPLNEQLKMAKENAIKYLTLYDRHTRYKKSWVATLLTEIQKEDTSRITRYGTFSCPD